MSFKRCLSTKFRVQTASARNIVTTNYLTAELCRKVMYETSTSFTRGTARKEICADVDTYQSKSFWENCSSAFKRQIEAGLTRANFRAISVKVFFSGT